MRKALLAGLSVMMVGAVFAAPASAQGAPSAGGSCGYQAGSYGLNSLSPIDVRNPNRGLGSAMTVSRVHWQVQYSGVGQGSRLTVLRYFGSSNEGPDLSTEPAVTTFTAQSGAGEFAASNAVGADTGATRFRANKNGSATTSNKARSGRNGGTSGGGSHGSQAGAGLWMFQVWNGDNLIGTFNCAVDAQ